MIIMIIMIMMIIIMILIIMIVIIIIIMIMILLIILNRDNKTTWMSLICPCFMELSSSYCLSMEFIKIWCI